MSKNPSKTKTTKGPWVPPPGRSRKLNQTFTKTNSDCNVSQHLHTTLEKPSIHMNVSESEMPETHSVNFNISEKTTHKGHVLESKTHERRLDVLECAYDILETSSLASNASMGEIQNETKLYLCDIKKSQQTLNLYFLSLRPISQFLNRFFNNVNLKDGTLKELLYKIEQQLNYLMKCFENLEYSLCLFENTLLEDRRLDGFQNILKLREHLLSTLLDCYTDILTVFQVSLEDRQVSDATFHGRERNILKTQLEAYQKKNQVQSSTIKDLEKRISLLQAKYSTLESYNNTVEQTKYDLQKIILNKDLEFKKLSSEVNEIILKQNDEKLIELIEEIKFKAKTEKTALKKALKVQLLKDEEKSKLIKKLEGDIAEKLKMLFDLADQRDRLKVQLTVAKNELVQAKYTVEKIKSQKMKQQDDFSESEINFKSKFEKETESLKKQLTETHEENLNMQKTIKKLENDLSVTVQELENLKSSQNNKIFQTQNNNSEQTLEGKNIISYLEDIKEMFKNIQHFNDNAKGDNIQTDRNTNNENILTIVQDIKQQIDDVKSHGIIGNTRESEKTNIIKEFENLQQSYETLSKENAALKSLVNELKNAEPVSTLENICTDSNTGAYFSVKDLQMKLMLKDEENSRIKQREKRLEYQLEEVKDKLQKKEMENCRFFSLEETLKLTEEELRVKKQELALLEKRKQEESEKLLNRMKELQEAVDAKTLECERLQKYNLAHYESFWNVFGVS